MLRQDNTGKTQAYRVEDIVIDPTNLTGMQSRLLAAMLSSHRTGKYKINVFHKTDPVCPVTYSVFMPDPDDPSVQVEYKIALTHTLIHRTKIAKDKKLPRGKKKMPRYSIVSNNKADRLGHGSYGEVWRLAGTLTHKSNGGMKLKSGKRRIVKILSLLRGSDPDIVKLSKSEAAATELARHLAGKGITFEKDRKGRRLSAYIFMNEIEGNELYYYIDQDIKASYRLFTVIERIRLSRRLAMAMDRQVHELGLVHRDVKPENIMLDRSKLHVKFIDYGFAIQYTKRDMAYRGTDIWSAPEVLNNFGCQDQSSDAYSLGLMLLVLWRGKARFEFRDRQWLDAIMAGREAAAPEDVQSLASNMGISVIQARKINDAIQSLMDSHQSCRATAKEVAEKFELIELDLELTGKLPDQQRQIMEAHNQGKRTADALRQIEKSSSGRPLAALKLAITNALNSIADTPEAIGAFVDMLDIEAFDSMQTRAAIIDVMTNAIAQFETSMDELTNLIEQINKINTDAFNILHQELKPLLRLLDVCNGSSAELEDINAELGSLLDKPLKAKWTISLDDIIRLNSILMKGISELHQHIKTYEAARTPELFTSYHHILDRLNRVSEDGKDGDFKRGVKFTIKKLIEAIFTREYVDNNLHTRTDGYREIINKTLHEMEKREGHKLVRRVNKNLHQLRALQHAGMYGNPGVAQVTEHAYKNMSRGMDFSPIKPSKMA